jgi:hypothetical protein
MPFNNKVVKREKSMKSVGWKCARLNIVEVVESLSWANEPRGGNVHAKSIYRVYGQAIEDYLRRNLITGLLLSDIKSRKTNPPTLRCHTAREARHYIGKIV